MFGSPSQLQSQSIGMVWIAVGLGIVLASQIFAMVPIAAAMMLIGCGSTQILSSWSKSTLVLLGINAATYALLGCFAIASQLHALESNSLGPVSLILWTDHLIAILLIALHGMAVVNRSAPQ